MSWTRRLAWAVVGVLSAGLLLSAALVALVATPPGRNMLEDLVAAATEGTSTQVNITSLAPGLPFRIAAREVTLSDDQGVWLRLVNPEIRLRVSALAHGKLRVPLVSLHSGELLRLPPGGEDPEPGPLLPELPSYLDSILVETLEIGSFRLDEAALGAAAVLRAEGGMSVSNSVLSAELNARSLEGPSEALNLLLEFDRRNQYLDLTLSLAEGHGGLICTLSGLDCHGPADQGADVVLAVDGEGHLDDWRGTLLANLGTIFNAQGDIRFGPEERSFVGRATMGKGLLPPAAEEALGREWSLELRTTQQDDLLHLDGTTLRTKGPSLTAGGWLNLDAETMDTRLVLDVPGLRQAARESGVLLDMDTPITMDFKGPLLSPAFALSVQANELGAEGLALDAVRLHVDGDWIGEQMDGVEANAFINTGPVRFEGQRISKDFHLRLRARTPDMDRLVLETLELSGDGLSGAASGLASLEQQRMEGRVRLGLERVSRILEVLDVPGDGDLRLSADLRSDMDLRAEGEIQGALVKISGLDPVLEAVLGSSVAFSGQLFSEPGTLGVRDLSMQAGLGVLRADASLDNADQLQAEATLQASNTDELWAALGADLQGGFTASASATGQVDNPEVSLEVKSASLAVQNVALRDIELDVVARDLATAPQASVQAQLQSPHGSFAASGDVSMGQELVFLQNLRAGLAGVSLEADLILDPATSLMHGEADILATDLSSLNELTGASLGGSARVQASLHQVDGTQQATVTATSPSLRAEGYTLDGLELTADLTDVLGQPAGTADFSASRLAGDGLVLAPLKAQAALAKDGGVEARASLEGSLPANLKLDTTGSYRPGDGGFDILLRELDGSYDGLPLQLADTATLSVNGQFISLDGLRLSLGQGMLTAKGQSRPDGINADLALQDLPTRNLPWEDTVLVDGLLNGSLNLAGTPRAPLADLALRVSDIRLPDVPKEFVSKQPQPPRAELKATYGPSGIEADASLVSGQDATATLTAKLPAKLSLSPFEFDASGRSPLTGSLDAALRLAALTPFTAHMGLLLKGDMSADWKLSGTLESPQITGPLAITNGRVEYVDTGTILANLQMQARAEGQAVTLTQLTATDGNGGRLSASGTADLSTGAPAYKLQADLKTATLLRMPLLESNMSGQVTMEGDQDGGDLTGDLTLHATNVNIPNEMAASVTEVDVTRVNTPEGFTPPSAEPGGDATAMPLNLDLRIDIPNRFFVRGLGLEAEFKGALDVQGTADSPILNGGLSLVRGKADLLNIPFVLTEGTLRFLGQEPPSPILDLKAEAEKNDILATVLLSGPPDDLSIVLSSQPALPQEEVISRLLFGKSVNNLSPVQGALLAQAVASLATGGGGPGITGSMRDFLKLDQLDVSDSESGDGYTLQVGRYVTEDVYVEAVKGLTSDENKVRVEVELTPNISVQSEGSTSGDSKVGIVYSIDY